MTGARHALDAFAATLRATGYTREAIAKATSVRSSMRRPELVRAAMLLQTERAGTPLALLVRLFHLGGAAPRAEATKTLADLPGLADAGVVELDGEVVRGLLRIDAYEGLLLACDSDPSRPDSVMGMSPSTQLTVAHTSRVRTARALDVGTGSGVHALLAARHADRVVATDVSPRALWMTELNIRLNGIDNVETREGSFFEPVAGERFGLVVSNPPYIVSPDTGFLYRDAAMERDSLCRTMLADLPGLLEPGGHATLQGNWIHRADEKWWRPIAASLGGRGCDLLMARISTDDPLEYAARWSEGHHAGDPDGFGRTLRRWLAYYEEIGAESLSSAMVVLRRRSDDRPGHRQAVSLLNVANEPTGDAFARLFDAQDRLAELDRDPGPRLRRAEGLTVGRRGGRYVLDCPRALGARRPVSAELAELVERLPGPGSSALADLVKLGYVVFDDAAG